MKASAAATGFAAFRISDAVVPGPAADQSKLTRSGFSSSTTGTSVPLVVPSRKTVNCTTTGMVKSPVWNCWRKPRLAGGFANGYSSE